MTSLRKLSPTILGNNGVKISSVISRLNSESSHENSPSRNRPMVTEDEINPKKNSENNLDDLEIPTTCCMSGCSNCVWIQYAEKLSERIKNSDGDIQKIIMDKVEDPNMRAFLSMELRCRNLVKS